jgi:hypothetical protein
MWGIQMMNQRPTNIPRIARKRIRDYVGRTGCRWFIATVVSAEPLTLARLADAGLLTAIRRPRATIYHLAEGDDVDQEHRFAPAFRKIRHWTNATEKYTFTALQVEVHGEVLDMMVKGGLLERRGWRYMVFWRSLAVNWQLRISDRAEGLVR